MCSHTVSVCAYKQVELLKAISETHILVATQSASTFLTMPQSHPYRNGYSVLPKLQRIPLSAVFHTDDELRERCLKAKKEAMATQQVCVRQDLGGKAEAEIVNWIHGHYPIALNGSTLRDFASQMSEDVIVHCLMESSDAMVFGHVCFPSGWDPVHAIGKSFEEIHQPVPGMNLKSSRKLVETIVQHGPFERFVWSVVFDDDLNGHPSRPRAEFRPRSGHALGQQGDLFVKVERQVTVPFGEHRCALFLLQQSLIPRQEIDQVALARALRKMSDAELRYKRLDQCRDALCHWLESCADSDSSSRPPIGNER